MNPEGRPGPSEYHRPAVPVSDGLFFVIRPSHARLFGG